MLCHFSLNLDEVAAGVAICLRAGALEEQVKTSKDSVSCSNNYTCGSTLISYTENTSFCAALDEISHHIVGHA